MNDELKPDTLLLNKNQAKILATLDPDRHGDLALVPPHTHTKLIYSSVVFVKSERPGLNDTGHFKASAFARRLDGRRWK